MVRRSYPGATREALEAEFRSWVPVIDAILKLASRYRHSSLEATRLRDVACAMEEAITANGFSLLEIRGVYQGPEKIARAAWTR